MFDVIFFIFTSLALAAGGGEAEFVQLGKDPPVGVVRAGEAYCGRKNMLLVSWRDESPPRIRHAVNCAENP
jgi:hypothetical protein